MHRNRHRKNGNLMVDLDQPHNVEAEEALLGACLIDPDNLIYIANLHLSAGDFSIERNGWLFEVMSRLVENNQPAGDMLIISDELERRGQLGPFGGSARLSELINLTPSSVDGPWYARIVKRASVLRRLAGAAVKIHSLAQENEMELEEVLSRSSDALLGVIQANAGEARTLEHYGHNVLDRLERMMSNDSGLAGLPTGLKDLDKLLGGLQRGDLIILAGRPGMGKSALATQIAIETGRTYRAHSLYVSREMSGEALTQRIIAYESGVDVQRIRNGTLGHGELKNVIASTSALPDLPLAIDSEANTPEAVRAAAIMHKARYGLDLIVVDYIQRMEAPGYQNRAQEVGAISKRLKSLALDLDVPVIAISSLSRQCEARNNKRPRMSDLKESGDLEHDADVIGFLYRDDYYYTDSDAPNTVELNIDKFRMGPTGLVTLFFRKHLTRFENLAIEQQIAYDWVN